MVKISVSRSDRSKISRTARTKIWPLNYLNENYDDATAVPVRALGVDIVYISNFMFREAECHKFSGYTPKNKK